MSQLPRELFALVLSYASPYALVQMSAIARYNASVGRELEHRSYIFEQRARKYEPYQKIDNQDNIQELVEYHGNVGIDRKGSIIFFLQTVWILPKSVYELGLKRLIYYNYIWVGLGEIPDLFDVVYIDQEDRLRLFHLYQDYESDTHSVAEKIIAYDVQQATVSLMKNQNGDFDKVYLVLNKHGSLLYLSEEKELTIPLPSAIEVTEIKIFTLGPLQFIALLDIVHTLHIYSLVGMVLMQQIKDVLLVINHPTSFAYLTLDNKLHIWDTSGLLTFDENPFRIPFLNGHLFLRRRGNIQALTPCQLLKEYLLDNYLFVNLLFKE